MLVQHGAGLLGWQVHQARLIGTSAAGTQPSPHPLVTLSSLEMGSHRAVAPWVPAEH